MVQLVNKCKQCNADGTELEQCTICERFFCGEHLIWLEAIQEFFSYKSNVCSPCKVIYTLNKDQPKYYYLS